MANWIDEEADAHPIVCQGCGHDRFGLVTAGREAAKQAFGEDDAVTVIYGLQCGMPIDAKP